MAPTQTLLRVKEVLEKRRTISIHNLAACVDLDVSRLTPFLVTLQREGALRVAQGKGCGGSCSSCLSCDDERYTGEEIVVSKITGGEYSYADE